MMHKLMRHGERLAAERAQRTVRAVAAQLVELVHDASVEIAGSQVVVSGRGLGRQWLSGPALRFLGKPR